MKKPHKHAALIKLWADGETIEYYGTTTKKWHVIPEPSWCLGVLYRIQPPSDKLYDAFACAFTICEYVRFMRQIGDCTKLYELSTRFHVSDILRK